MSTVDPDPGEDLTDQAAAYESAAKRQIEDIAASPERVEQLLESLERQLAEGVSFRDLLRVMQLVVGFEGFMTIVLSVDDDLDEIRALGLSPPAEAMLIRLVASYGPRLSHLWHTSGAPGARGDDWATADHQVQRDLETKRTRFTLTIEKFNGDTMVLRGSVGSALRLASRILAMVKIVDPQEIPARDRAEFARLAERLISDALAPESADTAAKIAPEVR